MREVFRPRPLRLYRGHVVEPERQWWIEAEEEEQEEWERDYTESLMTHLADVEKYEDWYY